MSEKHDSDLKKMEDKAGELVSLAFELCEKRLAFARMAPTPPQAALSAAAMSVHHSVETFLAVSRVPDRLIGE
jgi:hypothetical protein